MQKVFRLKHIPTGLYYRPARKLKSPKEFSWYKSNLSKEGKVYTKKPPIPTYIFDHEGSILQTQPEDWEICKFQVDQI